MTPCQSPKIGSGRINSDGIVVDAHGLCDEDFVCQLMLDYFLPPLVIKLRSKAYHLKCNYTTKQAGSYNTKLYNAMKAMLIKSVSKNM